MSQPRKPRQRPLTLADLAPDAAELTPEQVRERLAMPPRNLDAMTAKMLRMLTPAERKLVEQRQSEAWGSLFSPSQTPAPKSVGIAEPLGKMFGAAGSVVGTLLDWTTDAFKRLNDDLQRARAERDEARTDAVALAVAYETGGTPSQACLDRIRSYAVAEKKDNEGKPT